MRARPFALGFALGLLVAAIAQVILYTGVSTYADVWGSGYIKRNTGNASTDVLSPGTVTQLQVRAGWFVAPECPVNVSSIEFGSFCKDSTAGKINYRDGGGIKQLP